MRQANPLLPALAGHGAADVPGSVQDSFLDVTPDLLACFPLGAMPMRLYEQLPENGRLQAFSRADERLSFEKRRRLKELCDKGLICISRADSACYTDYVADSMHLLLREKQFTPAESAEIMLKCMTRRVTALLEQPVRNNYQKMREDTEIAAWLLQQEPYLAFHTLSRLHGEYSLPRKSVNVGFLGLAMLLRIKGDTLSYERLVGSAMALFLHDIGLIRVQSFIRDKANRLSMPDWRRIREHPEEGVRILRKLGCVDEDILTCVFEHQERLDGSGYPCRLKGDDIQFLAKLCGVAESFCAMRLERNYRPALGTRQALNVLVKDAKRYDLGLVYCVHEVLGDHAEAPDLPRALTRHVATGVPRR